MGFPSHLRRWFSIIVIPAVYILHWKWAKLHIPLYHVNMCKLAATLASVAPFRQNQIINTTINYFVSFLTNYFIECKPFLLNQLRYLTLLNHSNV